MSMDQCSILLLVMNGVSFGPNDDPVDNLTSPGLYQLKPGDQQLYYNTTQVNLGIGGSFVYVRGKHY